MDCRTKYKECAFKYTINIQIITLFRFICDICLLPSGKSAVFPDETNESGVPVREYAL